MAVDLFRLIDIRNRQAFRIEGRDGKDYRTRLVALTRQIEADLRNVMASNYLSTIGGPNYTIALRAYALEFARIRLTLEDLRQDGFYDTEAYCSPRADIIYQKVSSLMGVDKDLQLTIFSSQEFCQFTLALVQIFFGGSTPANIVRGIELFVGEVGVVTLFENFIDAKDPNSTFDISDQFGFRIDFELTENISSNFSDIGIKLDFLLKLIKPAHTLFLLRFIFSEIVDTIRDADDTFQVENICDHAYDDARKYCAGVEGRDRLGVNTIRTATETLTGMAGTVIETTFGPLSKNASTPIIAEAVDIILLVDGSPVTITSIVPADGIINLAVPILTTQTVVVTYFYWHSTTFTLLLNNPGMVLPGRGKFSSVQYVLNNAEGFDPIQVTWQYEAYQRGYTAVLNDPTSLLLNEPPHQLCDPITGRLLGHRHVLNWANYVRSPDQTHSHGFEHILNEGTPIVELRNTFDPVFEFETEFIVPDDVGWGVAPWGSNTLGWGSPFLSESEEITFPQWVITSPGGKFITPMITSKTEVGTPGLLAIACEESLDLTFDHFEETYEFPDIPGCDEDGLFIMNQSNMNGPDLLNNFAGVAGCELTLDLVVTIPDEDTSAVPGSATDDFTELSAGGEEDKINAWDTTGMFIMNESDVNGTDVLWDNEILGHWNDEGNIVVLFGGVFHLPSYGKDLVAGAPP